MPRSSASWHWSISTNWLERHARLAVRGHATGLSIACQPENLLRASLHAVASDLPSNQDRSLAKPNYSYEKRQKELAKERKKQEKLQRKANKPGSTQMHGEDSGSATPPDADTASNTAPTSGS